MTEADSSILTGFTSLIAGLEQENGFFTIELPDDWLQGRTAYGGLSAALCLEATLRAFPNLPPLRSAHFSFVGPAVGVLRVTAEILRQGKSTAFTSAEIEGERGIATRANLCFGSARATNCNYINISMPTVSRPDTYPFFFTWPNRPNFMRHFDGRLAAGGWPCSASANPEMLVWLRHCDQEIDHSIVNLLALADALPPAFFVLLHKPVLISTVTWSVDFLDEYPRNQDGWWLVKSAAESAQHGFSTQNILIWAPDGRLVITARQNIAVFGDA